MLATSQGRHTTPFLGENALEICWVLPVATSIGRTFAIEYGLTIKCVQIDYVCGFLLAKFFSKSHSFCLGDDFLGVSRF